MLGQNREIRAVIATPFLPPKVVAVIPVVSFPDILFLKPGEVFTLLYNNPVNEGQVLPLASRCEFIRYVYNNAVVPFVEAKGISYLRLKTDVNGQSCWEELGSPPIATTPEEAKKNLETLLQTLQDYQTTFFSIYKDVITSLNQLDIPLIPNLYEELHKDNLPIEEQAERAISVVFTFLLPPPLVREMEFRLFLVEAVHDFVNNVDWTVEGIFSSLTALLLRGKAFYQTFQSTRQLVHQKETQYGQIHALKTLLRVATEELKKLAPEEVSLPAPFEQIKARFEQKKDDLPDEVRAYIKEQLNYFEETSNYLSSGVEGAFALRHVSYLLDLPWKERATDEPLPMDEVERLLNERFYGMRQVKERVLDIIYTLRRLNLPTLRGRILCFVGPPGVGKTALSLLLSQILRRPLQKIHVGGISDESEIRGHRRTYVGATAGRIIEAIRRAGVKNPIIVLEEVDKLFHGGIKGDPIAALMEVLDPEQNHSFVDHYVDFPFDLSEVFFIATANDEDNIHPTLRDRMEIVYLRPYFFPEKVAITRDYLLPKICEELKVSPSDLTISDEDLRWFVANYSFGGGVRELERNLRLMIERHLRRAPDEPITPERIMSYLSQPPIKRMRRLESPTVGVAPVLVVTSQGEGDVLFVQVSSSYSPKKKENILSGSLTEVPKEVVSVALTLLARQGVKINLPVHVHQTAHSVPKVGSSGGLSTFCALYSFATGKPLPPDWAFTGEIDLLGNVHPVGGIAAKLVAAEQAGYTHVFLPKENEEDVALMDIPVGLKTIFVKNVQEVVKYLEERKGVLKCSRRTPRSSQRPSTRKKSSTPLSS